MNLFLECVLYTIKCGFLEVTPVEPTRILIKEFGDGSTKYRAQSFSGFHWVDIQYYKNPFDRDVAYLLRYPTDYKSEARCKEIIDMFIKSRIEEINKKTVKKSTVIKYP